MKKKIFLILLLILSFVPLTSLFHPGLPLTHDGPDHVARIANFYQALKEGIIVPRWAANLNWGYGHPILMFLYPLPSYIAFFFHFLGFSLVDSTKLVFGVSFIGSVLAMFLWLNAEWGPVSGFIGALLYGFAPYRFVDLYVRGAIGEHMAFVFVPLILYGLQAGNILITAFSFAALILSHNAISLMFLPIIGLYCVHLFYKSKGKKTFITNAIFSLISGLLLSAFFWMPAFFEGKYTLRDIVTKGTVQLNFSLWSNFFYMPWSYGGSNLLSKEIGFVQWVGVFGAILIFLKKKNTQVRWIIGISLAILVVCLFLMTGSSVSIWNTVTILQKFQFPWRLLSLTTFLAAVLGALVIRYLPKKLSVWIVIFVVIALVGTTYFMWYPKSYSLKDDRYYSDIYNSTTDTGESSPIWSVRFMEHRPLALMQIVEGSGTIMTVSRTTTKHIYKITADTDSRILENTLYFPGWIIRVDGSPVSIEFQDPLYRGLMTFRVSKGSHTVVVSFEDTKLRKVANILSISGLLLLMGWVFVKKRI